LDEPTGFVREVGTSKRPGDAAGSIRLEMKKKLPKVTIKKDDLRPRERAPILPSKRFVDKRTRDERRPKYKKDPRSIRDEE
jgi:hypothetical protein